MKISVTLKNFLSRLLSRSINLMLQKTGLIAFPLNQGINLESTIKYYVKPELVQTIFDIGAHNGSWAKNIGKKTLSECGDLSI